MQWDTANNWVDIRECERTGAKTQVEIYGKLETHGKKERMCKNTKNKFLEVDDI